MANYWMVKELEKGGVTTLEELKEYMIVSIIIYYIYIYILYVSSFEIADCRIGRKNMRRYWENGAL